MKTVTFQIPDEDFAVLTEIALRFWGEDSIIGGRPVDITTLASRTLLECRETMAWVLKDRAQRDAEKEERRKKEIDEKAQSAAKSEPPKQPQKPMMTNPILPGDKVRCVTPNLWGYAEANLFIGMPHEGKVYSVRSVAADAATGKQRVRLVGIYGSPLDGAEPAFDVDYFKPVSNSAHAVALPMTDQVDMSVRVTKKIADSLAGAPLGPMVGSYFELTEGNLESVCRRWVNKWRQSMSIGDMHQAIEKEIQASEAHVVPVPLSGFAVADLLVICKKLEIEPEAWLQGILGNLARRLNVMRERYAQAVRNAPRRKAAKERWDRYLKNQREGRDGKGGS